MYVHTAIENTRDMIVACDDNASTAEINISHVIAVILITLSEELNESLRNMFFS